MVHQAKSPVISIVTVTGLLICAFSIAAAQPETVVVGFEGAVTYLDDWGCFCIPEEINLGATIHGYYVYELGAVDQDPLPNIGRYHYSSGPSQIVVYIEGYVFRSIPPLDMNLSVTDSVDYYGTRDRYHVDSWNNTRPIAGETTNRIWFSLEDSTLRALTGDALPTSVPVLAEWSEGGGLWMYGGNFWQIFGELSTITSGPSTVVTPHSRYIPRLTAMPNPFSGTTRFEFQTDSGRSVLAIYDVRGKSVRTVYDANVVARAAFSVEWDGADDSGKLVPNGVYFARVVTPTYTEVRKLVHVR